MKYKHILLLMSLLGCKALEAPIYENPLIPGDPGYMPPAVTLITAIEDGSVWPSHSVTFAWSGNRPTMLFAYKLSGKFWSEWQLDTSITFNFLDEGANQFSVKGKYFNLITDEHDSMVQFTIDDIAGPAIWLKPRFQTKFIGQSVVIDVMLEDVNDLMAMSIEIGYTPSEMSVWAVNIIDGSGSFISSNGATITSSTNIDTTGTITIDLLASGGNPLGMSGSGAIVRINGSANANTTITIQPTSILRDINDEAIVILEKVNAAVEIKN